MKPGVEGLNPLDITNFYLFEGMGRNSLITDLILHVNSSWHDGSPRIDTGVLM